MKVVNFFKNKKYLVLYLVGVLILSMGVSFAYFSATAGTNGDGSIAQATTATVSSEGVIANGAININEIDIYPGHKAISSIEVTGTGDNQPLIYNVIFNGTNTFTTDINYKVYKTTTNINASYNCTKEQSVVDGTLRYYETCNGTSIDELGEVISSGTITKSSTEAKTILVNDEVLLTTINGNKVYYYVEIEYPNLDSNQNSDMTSTLSGNITVDESTSEYTNPSMIFTASTTAGSNNWYKSVSINTSITTHTGNYDVLYCTTTSSSCTPNTTPTISDNQFSVTLSNNASAQKLCVSIVDEYGQTAEGCSSAYSVDATAPTVSITSTSKTSGSITVNVSGSDSHSGVATYYYSSNGGSSYTSSTSSSHTFSNLSGSTTYAIRVYVVDRAGNQSSVASTSVTTDAAGQTIQSILAEKTISTRSDFSTTLSTDTTGTVYSATDDDGTTYYFAGAPTDNWVSFAGFYWRIIRVNGDGSIRLIYSGSESSGPATRGTSTEISTSAFNSSQDDNMYVGYMYTSGEVHGLGTSSTIKGVLDTWYSNNLASYASYIDTNAGFCGDRTSYSGSGTGTTETAYGAGYRLNTSNTPTFSCSNNSDLYTTSSSNKGNKALTYPIGLITADEVAYAGGMYGGGSGYYLWTNQYYWTMSPSGSGSCALVFFVNSSGSLWDRFTVFSGGSLRVDGVTGGNGVRPVINLKADTIFELGGTGTSTNPYVVV